MTVREEVPVTLEERLAAPRGAVVVVTYLLVLVVIGFALFTAGALDDRWDSYDVTGFLRHIAQDIIVPQAN